MKKNQRKFAIFFSLLSIMLFVSACSFSEDSVKSESMEDDLVSKTIVQEISEEETEKVPEKEPEVITGDNAEEPQQILRFIDAWEEWHEVVIDPDIPKHMYDLNSFQKAENTVSYVGDDRYIVREGVDVSYHQGKIDWEKVKNDGIDFAIIRIGYRGYGKQGSLRVDTEFENNIINARDAGLDVGVYIFSQAVNEQEALEEAQLVIDELRRVGVELQLPVVYDPELIRDSEARTDNVTGEQFTKNTIAFCEKIKEAGYEPMIYSNMVWEAFYFDLLQLTEYPIWYADYEDIPQTPYWFSFWQYACDGQVDGIPGRVDMNLQFILKEDIEEENNGLE